MTRKSKWATKFQLLPFIMSSYSFSETSSIHSSQQSFQADPANSVLRLIEGLKDSDIVVRNATLESIDKFCKNSQFVQAVIHSQQLFSLLVDILKRSAEVSNNFHYRTLLIWHHFLY